MEPEQKAQIGIRLKALRQEFGLSQRDWAKLLQVNPNTVARWERGELEPRGAHRKKVEQVLSISEDEKAKNIIKDTLQGQGGLAATGAFMGMLFGVLGVVGVGLAVLAPLMKKDSTLLQGIQSYIADEDKKNGD